MTVHQPGNQLVEVKVLLMEFMRGHNMKAGHVIPVKPYQFTFVPSLNAKQRTLLNATLDALMKEGVLVEDQGNYRLTDLGFEALY
ncbi:hypothetical protein ACEPUD_22830 [Burkholderia ubonensis]|uniref:hypothetical protein n=1 Tax=Burkholderia ubonensis TaxID=101571 RepID=UPI0012FC3DB5|nr:hypothetical protein [Burkholderia ubonensis]